jgi:hypothetical protein
MNKDKWNEICFLLSENIKKDISESSFEQNVIQALSVLGWKQFYGDFEIRPTYQLGAANRLTPDFVVKSLDNHKLFVIEIKQPNIPINSIFQQQLFSYIRLLRLEYGILIGEVIQIFYDGVLSKQEDPILLDTIRFERNSDKGEIFVKLFSKESFNFDSLHEYTAQSLKEINREKEIKVLLNKILSENYKEKVFSLMKQDLISEYDGELLDSVLNKLKIEITTKVQNVVNNSNASKAFNLVSKKLSKEIESKTEQNDIRILDLIHEKLLSVGDILSMSYGLRGSEKKTYYAEVLEDGSLKVLGKIYKASSYAAVACINDAGSSREHANGWTSWKTKDGKTLNQLRQLIKYRSI